MLIKNILHPPFHTLRKRRCSPITGAISALLSRPRALGRSFSSRPILPSAWRVSFSYSFSAFSFTLRRDGCTLEDGSYLRGTRSTLHRRDPVVDPHPPAFRSGLPFCHANTVPPPHRPRPRPRPHRACSSHWARKGGQHTNPASSFARRGMEKSPTSPWGPPSRALPTTTGKHRPISQRFS